MLPSIFGESLFDDWMDFPFRGFTSDVDHKLYGKHAARVMKTDLKEHDEGYELSIDLPGFKKDQILFVFFFEGCRKIFLAVKPQPCQRFTITGQGNPSEWRIKAVCEVHFPVYTPLFPELSDAEVPAPHKHLRA